MTPAQIAFIRNRWKRITFIFDPEPAAQKRALRYAEECSALGMETEILDLEWDHDPGDASPEEVKQVRIELFGL